MRPATVVKVDCRLNHHCPPHHRQHRRPGRSGRSAWPARPRSPPGWPPAVPTTTRSARPTHPRADRGWAERVEQEQRLLSRRANRFTFPSRERDQGRGEPICQFGAERGPAATAGREPDGSARAGRSHPGPSRPIRPHPRPTRPWHRPGSFPGCYRATPRLETPPPRHS